MSENIEGERLAAVLSLLYATGDNPAREGLLNTPKRYLKALKEMTAGYQMDPAEILSRTFEVERKEFVVDGYIDRRELICLRDIRFSSLCEHHLFPFVGVAHVGYKPTDTVFGISKLARLVECFARRLQIQERMTDQIAEALIDAGAECAGVVIQAKHGCMGCRGVNQPDSSMITRRFIGPPVLASEFWGLVFHSHR